MSAAPKELPPAHLSPRPEVLVEDGEGGALRRRLHNLSPDRGDLSVRGHAAYKAEVEELYGR